MHRISDIKKPQVSTCEVRAKNGWETIFEPVLGHIKFLGQIKAPKMLEWGLEHPGHPRYPQKNYTYQNRIWKTTFIAENFLYNPQY